MNVRTLWELHAFLPNTRARCGFEPTAVRDRLECMRDIEVVHEFGKLLEEVGERMLTHYPSCNFPRSLLPYEKQVIRSALERMIQAKEKQGDKGAIKILRTGLVWLDWFVDDKKAYRANHEVLGRDGYLETIQKN